LDGRAASAGAGPARRRARRGGVAGPGRVLAGLAGAVFLPLGVHVREAGEGPAAGDACAGRFGRGAHRAAAAVFGPALGRGRAGGPRRDVQLRPLARLRRAARPAGARRSAATRPPRQHSRALGHWLGPAGPGVPAQPVGPGAGEIPGCAPLLVRALRPLSAVGPARRSRAPDSGRHQPRGLYR
nr:hypothetical protein [Tanacetum cinerariifolium]